MHRYIDTFFILLGIFVLSFALCGLFTARFAIKLAVSFISVIAGICVLAMLARKIRRNGTDYRSFVTYCIIAEEHIVADIMKKAGFISSDSCEDGFYDTADGAACLHLKFSKPSRDNIISLYKKCIKKNIKKLTVWCAEFERAGVAIACTLPDVEFRFRNLRPLYKTAKKRGLLTETFERRPRSPLKTLLPIVLSTRNSYRFAFVSLILFALSMLTPLKAYYITVAAIVLIIAVVSRIYGEKSDSSS